MFASIRVPTSTIPSKLPSFPCSISIAMPPSMRKRSVKAKKIKKENMLEKKKLALNHLYSGSTVRDAAAVSGISHGTASRLSSAINKKDKTQLKQLLSPTTGHAGRKPHLNKNEEKQIRYLIVVAAARGFAVTTEQLQALAGEFAKECGKDFKKGIPSIEWTRNFAQRHKILTRRKCERQDMAKHHASHPDHVATYAMVLKKVEVDNPGIFDRPELFLNMDETAVDGLHSGREKVFSLATSRYGGSRLVNNSGLDKHVTAVIITSAAGHVLPPFFVFAGKYRVSDWFVPLSSTVFRDQTGPHWLTRSDWFPSGSFVVGTPNGSMDMSIIKHVIEHINKHYRCVVPKYQKICLALDGHSSRNALDWLKLAKQYNIEIVQSPNNTSHFLQPNDDTVNRCFKVALRGTKSWLCSKKLMSFNGVGMKLRLGVAGYRSITPDIVQRAYRNTGLWPMDFRFVEMAKQKYTGNLETSKRGRPRQERAVTALKEVETVLNSRSRWENPIRTFERLSDVIQKRTHKSVVSTFFECELNRSNSCSNVLQLNNREVFRQGGPALYMTHKDFMEQREKNRAKRQKEKAEKENAKIQREVDRKRKREEKQKLLEELERKKRAKVEKKKAKTDAKEKNSTHVFSTDNQDVQMCAGALMDLTKANETMVRVVQPSLHVMENESEKLLGLRVSPRPKNQQGEWLIRIEDSVGDQTCLEDPNYCPHQWYFDNQIVP